MIEQKHIAAIDEELQKRGLRITSCYIGEIDGEPEGEIEITHLGKNDFLGQWFFTLDGKPVRKRTLARVKNCVIDACKELEIDLK